MAGGRFWEPDEDKQVRKAARYNRRPGERMGRLKRLAKLNGGPLDRTVSAIHQRAHKLGLLSVETHSPAKVAALRAKGQTVKQIARRFNMSEGAVREAARAAGATEPLICPHCGKAISATRQD